jgi:transcriptional/translational regulatory protein YebC/TACO1
VCSSDLPKTPKPQNYENSINLQKVFSLMEALEDNDDVQRVFSNIEFSAELLSALTD